MTKILIVGAGATGASIVRLLTSDAYCKLFCRELKLTIYEKEQDVGGRMYTVKKSAASVDLGAQYVSCTPENFENNQDIYESLSKQGILEKMTCKIFNEKSFPVNTRHYIARSGASSIVKQLIKEANCQVCLNSKVKYITRLDNMWNVFLDNDSNETFDAIITTVPVPQLFCLGEDITSIIHNQQVLHQNLSKVQYSFRFAIGLFYDQHINTLPPWAISYIKNDPCLCFISIDNLKRNNPDEPTSICGHASVPFSLQHIEEFEDDVCMNFLLPQIKKHLPSLPRPAEIKSHKWHYSQVHVNYPGSPGAVIINDDPPFILAGDAFTKSGFDGCIKSARESCIKLANILQYNI